MIRTRRLPSLKCALAEAACLRRRASRKLGKPAVFLVTRSPRGQAPPQAAEHQERNPETPELPGTASCTQGGTHPYFANSVAPFATFVSPQCAGAVFAEVDGIGLLA